MSEPITTTERAEPSELVTQAPQRALPAPAPWPKGHRLDAFELHEAVACSSTGIVYRAWDHGLALPVAVKEYLPARLAARGGDGRVAPLDGDSTAAFERGLMAFVDEARTLARCDHPALVRVLHLQQAHGTAYRVMPWYTGSSLLEVRRDMAGPPDEAALRSLVDSLLGALEAWQRVGGVHGGLHPAQILLLADDRALLLGPGAAQRAMASDPPLRPVDPGFAPEQASPSAATALGPWTDFHALAELARFCISGMLPPLLQPATAEPLATMLRRRFSDDLPRHYSDAFLRTLDAAASPNIAERPQTVAQFREWLDGAPQRGNEAADTGEAETLRLIQRAIASVPPAPPRQAQPQQPQPIPIPIPLPLPQPQPQPQPLPLPQLQTPSLPPQPPARPPEVPISAPVAAANSDWAPELVVDRVPLARINPPRQRRPVLWAGSALAVLGLLAYSAWQWQSPAPPSSVATLARLQPAAPPAAEVTPVPTPTPAPAQTPAPTAAAVPTPAPVPPPAAPSPAETPPPAASSLAEEAPAAAAPAPAPKPARKAAPTPVRKPATRTARADTSDPRALCGGRTEFSLYRCMQQQCSQPKWARHPQCQQLKATDRVG